MALGRSGAGAVNLALPNIGRSFGEAPARAILLVVAYQLALLMALLPSAHIDERIGQRRLFVAGVGTFSPASALCSIAWSFPMLVAARFLQGLGGAAILALGISLLRYALSNERCGSAIAWNAMNVAICSAAGPLIGALILNVLSWHWLFLAQLPLAAFAILAARRLPLVSPTRTSTETWSIMLYAMGAAFLVSTISLLPSLLMWSYGLAAGSVLSIGLLIRTQRRTSAPLVPLDLLDNPFRITVFASMLCFTAQTAGLLALPFHLQLALGKSAITSALVLASWPIGVVFACSFANSLSQKFSASRLCTTCCSSSAHHNRFRHASEFDLVKRPVRCKIKAGHEERNSKFRVRG